MIVRRITLAAVLAAAPVLAAAGCTTRDRWQGSDKDAHAVAGLVIGTAATLHFRSRWAGFATGAAVGVLKELGDTQGSSCSLQDAAITALGAALGAQLGGFALRYSHGRASLAWSTDF